MAAPTVEQLDYVIVGSGPAGLQMGQQLGAAGRSYVILEAGGRPGTFFSTYPRHRTLLSINKRFNYFPEAEFNLRHDWNSLLSDGTGPSFTDYSEELFPHADVLVRYLGDYAEKFELNIQYHSRATGITPLPDGGFTVADESGREYQCRRVLLGTGALAPLIPDIKGIELARGYEDHSLNPADYRGKRVAIIGQGNSAFEVANHIAHEAAMIHIMMSRPLKHAWRTHFPGDLRAINNSVLDMYQLKSLHATLGYQVKEIQRREPSGYLLLTETEFPHWDPPRRQEASFGYDEVIRCTGWKYTDTSMFPEGAAPATDDRGKLYTLDSTWQTSIPGLYCIGAGMQARDRKAATPFIHGFRYNVRTLFNLLEEKHYGVDLPGKWFPLRNGSDVDQVAAFLVERVSLTSALYQQFGTLCDALVVEDGRARIYPELPIDYVHERDGMRDAEHLVVVSLEYGFDRYPEEDPLEFTLPRDFARPDLSAFLHPVFRHYQRGELTDELRMRETQIVRYDIDRGQKLTVNGHQNRIANFFGRITGLDAGNRNEEAFSTAS